ncbi:GNAT family N-acetyltransferase [Antarcticimicrobium luteum]|uniref:GNAT family N-acetyltransferase n=1 Tax=Antarcticimicrobium luteum TaxID=2547397 RepID=A0A4R5UQ66_9RHOB|nr:GNAT family N-acetyltransferase [Antarcticimicrobium luteum]TDK41162.1 GNAT family N-acetyltransferase [Antarcticimicrobium luteum]
MSAPRIRTARPEDADACARVLTASITALCDADHHGDPAAIARWVANKTPEGVARMIAAGGIRVAELDGRIAAVGEIEKAEGKITLNYVDPARRGRGLSSALLAAMEAELARSGIRTARLTATATARDFYLKHGWQPAGPGRAGRWIVGYPMQKRLDP